MLNKMNRFTIALSPERREQVAQALASTTLFLAGYGLAVILIDLASLGL